MKLLGSSMSPFVERVLISLELKGQGGTVPVDDVPGGFKSSEHLALSPMGRIPILLLDDGRALPESQTIIEYLDGVLDGPDLLPTDAFDRAQLSAFCRVVDLDFFPQFRNIWPGRAPSEEIFKETVAETLPKTFDYLEFYAEKGGLLQPGKPTLADAALMPFLFHLYVFGRKAGIGDFGDRPILSAWHKASADSEIGKASFDRSSVSLAKFSRS